ncbi:hypothetical protein PSP6_220017 [Paraburkholderia tropica]|uniref:hypothetical protein n=2 Tax=Paraburkholderia TaxID=1822464 RepID=UPI001CAB96D0|nr:hypothetical protein [Paraburkholderia tropica]CAG9203911.1 hypothetical protein PSP6_220017 [Paraburkholderia tropica]
MFEAFAMSAVAVTAGASLTFLCAILLPDTLAKKSAEHGRYAALGTAPGRPASTRARGERRVRRHRHALP